MYNSNLLFLVFFWLYFIAPSFVINYLFYVRVQPELVLIPTGRILSVKWETIYPKALCIRSKLIRQREPFLIDVFFMHFDHMICGTDKERRYHGPILVLTLICSYSGCSRRGVIITAISWQRGDPRSQEDNTCLSSRQRLTWSIRVRPEDCQASAYR